MAEKHIEAIIFSTESNSDDIIYKLPIAMSFINNWDEVFKRIGQTSRLSNRIFKSFFIITSDETMANEKLNCSRFEENQRVLAVFNLIDNKCKRKVSNGKIQYVPKSLLTVTVSLMAMHYMKIFSDDKSDDRDLVEIYSRNIETIKMWLINNTRAMPTHVLVIPLNTSEENLSKAIEEIEKSCNNLGFPSTIIRTLSEYIPRTDIYDIIPYGKQYFEHETHQQICQLIRDLSPIRFYLYGNEAEIKSNWSSLMISEETDPSGNVVNDENLFWFLEHESISENIKWSFFSIHGRNWKVKNAQPIKSDSLAKNVIFQSGLKRAHMTYENRQKKITARMFNWHQINEENKNLLTIVPKRIDLSNPLEQIQTLLSPDYRSTVNVTSMACNKKERVFKLNKSFNLIRQDQMNAVLAKISTPTYLWIGENLSIDSRFQNVVFPEQWTHFFDLNSYETSIRDQYLNIDTKIMTLVLSTTFAQKFFTNIKHIRNFRKIYLFGQTKKIPLEYINQYENVQGIYRTIDSLLEQFELDNRSNTNVSVNPPTKVESFLPFSFIKDDDEISYERQAVETSLAIIAPQPTKEEFNQALKALRLDDKITEREKQSFIERYRPHEAIQWYTRNGFLYRLINQSLACRDIESVKRYQVFIDDLLRAMNELYKESRHNYDLTFGRERLIVYRGQAISRDELARFKGNIGEYVRLNSFLSTTESISVASMFAGADSSSSDSTSLVAVIFSFTIDLTKQYDTAFVSIESQSLMVDEEEYLFSMGALFEIMNIEEPSVCCRSWLVHLRMIDQVENHRFFSSAFDEKLHYRIAIHPNELEKIQTSNELNDCLQKSNLSLFDARQTSNFRAFDFDGESNCCLVLPTFCPVSNISEYCTEIRYEPMNTHVNDLIYLIISDMKKKIRLLNAVKLHEDFLRVQQIPQKEDFYVHLLHTPNYQFITTRFKERFPSSSVITFYRPDSCSTLFQMMSQKNPYGHINLLIQSDDLQVDNLVERFERFPCVHYIHLCTKNRSLVKHRRVIESLSSNEEEFYYQLTTEHATRARRRAREQIEIFKNPKQALEFLDEAQKSEQMLMDYQFTEPNFVLNQNKPN